MTVQLEPIPDPDPGGPRHVMTPDQFWERFIDMCQTTDSRTREMYAALFGNDAEKAEAVLDAGITGPEGLIPLMVQRIAALESQNQELTDRLSRLESFVDSMDEELKGR